MSDKGENCGPPRHSPAGRTLHAAPPPDHQGQTSGGELRQLLPPEHEGSALGALAGGR
jgi:hypothetical protein